MLNKKKMLRNYDVTEVLKLFIEVRLQLWRKGVGKNQAAEEQIRNRWGMQHTWQNRNQKHTHMVKHLFNKWKD
jgi:hypothetical protein